MCIVYSRISKFTNTHCLLKIIMYKSSCGILILLVVINVTSAKSVVETTHGSLSGKTFKTIFEKKIYHAFMGIPFAAPPVKDLRFKVRQLCFSYKITIRKDKTRLNGSPTPSQIWDL